MQHIKLHKRQIPPKRHQRKKLYKVSQNFTPFSVSIVVISVIAIAIIRQIFYNDIVVTVLHTVQFSFMNL